MHPMLGVLRTRSIGLRTVGWSPARCTVMLSLACGIASCRTPRANTWDEDATSGAVAARFRGSTIDANADGAKADALFDDDDDYGEGAPEFEVAPQMAPARSHAGLGEQDERRARTLELSLLTFASRRRAITARDAEKPRAKVWSPMLKGAWESVLDSVERSFEAPLGGLPSRALIQTRVTLEAELEVCERLYGKAPDGIFARVTKSYVAVAQHMRVVPRELAALTPATHDIALMWPLAPLVVTSSFGYRRDPISSERGMRFHAGLDLGGSPGSVITAAAPGRVISASWLGGHGRSVIVQHPGGYVTVYSHLNQVLVSQDSDVDEGSPVGLLGSTGRTTGPHLHFEVRHGGMPIDPLEIVGRHRPTAVSYRGRRASAK